MENVGLVLSGGGGKGAYEVGVWKALEELKIRPKAISGTSIGAINGALYLQGSLEIALDMWQNLSAWKLVVPNTENITKQIIAKQIDPYLSNFILKQKKGILDPKGIRSLLEEKVDLNNLTSSGIPFFVGAHDEGRNSIVYLPLHNLSPKERGDSIIASASLPGIFPPVEMNDMNLSDGGWHYLPGRNLDNTPIAPVYGQGCSTIIVVALEQCFEIQRDRYPNATILSIVPSEDLGGVLDGMLDCSREGADYRVNLGYRDTMKTLGNIGIQNDIAQKATEILLKMKENEDIFSNRRTEIPAQDIKTAMIQFNKAVRNDSFSEPIAIPEFIEEKVLKESTRAMLCQIDKDNIGIEVDSFIEAQSSEDATLSQTMFEAIALLSPVDSRSKGISNQGFFAGLIGRLSGKNGRISSENDQDLAKAQYAAFSMINAIQNKGLLSLELTVAANTKINALFSQIEEVRGEQKNQIIDLYKSLSTVFLRLRQEILADRQRIDSLERRLELVEWLQQIRTRTFNGSEYRSLSKPEALICLVNDFYRFTRGQWSIRELLTLKEALITLDMADDIVIPSKRQS
ncbi:patatin-like phospholipase family protein [Dethiosulfovibrio salsuginis]|uniref:Patatin-like phospholipase n=1 Tax=Dethiosulfovibrio salsuginis TaxID=561720 RepID=A0A1X7IMF5_9BACT|nr:patatin-like phospholipase family protein [Dethiosulfovibrio salsuginis]SMG16114.1 Patatin-like phospholipase [Dethiosulfovibrio salsuginis]